MTVTQFLQFNICKSQNGHVQEQWTALVGLLVFLLKATAYAYKFAGSVDKQKMFGYLNGGSCSKAHRSHSLAKIHYRHLFKKT